MNSSRITNVVLVAVSAALVTCGALLTPRPGHAQEAVDDLLSRVKQTMSPPIRYTLLQGGREMVITLKGQPDGRTSSRIEYPMPLLDRVTIVHGDDFIETFPDRNLAIRMPSRYESVKQHAIEIGSMLSHCIDSRDPASARIIQRLDREGTASIELEFRLSPERLLATIAEVVKNAMPAVVRMVVRDDDAVVLELHVTTELEKPVLDWEFRDVTPAAVVADSHFQIPIDFRVTDVNSMSEYARVIAQETREVAAQMMIQPDPPRVPEPFVPQPRTDVHALLKDRPPVDRAHAQSQSGPSLDAIEASDSRGISLRLTLVINLFVIGVIAFLFMKSRGG